MNKSEIHDLLNKCSLENETCKYLSYLSALYHGDPFPLPTGFDELDKHLNGGLYSGQLIAIGARPSVGKTAFAVSLARTMIERNKRILFFFGSCTKMLENRSRQVLAQRKA